MLKRRSQSYLRSYRKRSGLSQKELAILLGYPNEGEISRHERLCCAPPFRIALGYEAVFRVPASKLFPAAFAQVSEIVDTRLKDLEERLQSSTAKGRRAALIAQKLEWMWERKNSKNTDSQHELRIA